MPDGCTARKGGSSRTEETSTEGGTGNLGLSEPASVRRLEAMKRAAMREVVERHLAKIGIRQGSYVWQPATLIIVMGDDLRTFTLKGGISKRNLLFQMGRMAGLAEAAGITAPK